MTRYIVYGLSYTIFFRNKEGTTLVGIFYISHKMIMEYLDFDLCGLPKYQLMENLQLTKKTKNLFRFGTLIMYCDVFSEFPTIEQYYDMERE
jgi:hypothetical protein